jgi:hypothetical protein
LITIEALRLKVGSEWAVHIGTFVPIQSEPSEPVKNGLKGRFNVSILVRVVDAKQELPARLFC